MRHGSAARATFSNQAASPPASDLAHLLLAAALSSSFSQSPAATPRVDGPLPEAAALHVLRRPSLPASAKLSFFRWAISSAGYTPSRSAFSVLLRSLSHSRPPLLDPLRPLLRQALSCSPIAVDPHTFRSVLDAFLRCGRFDSAIYALADAEELVGPSAAAVLLTPSTYTSIVLALLQKSQLSLALSLLRKILRASIVPDALPCNQLLVALRKADRRDDFRSLFDELCQKGFLFDIWTYNICIHAFGSWGDLNLALGLFKELKTKEPQVLPDLCTYNSILGSLCYVGKITDALIVYQEMKEGGLGPDKFTYLTLINGCCKTYRLDEACRVFNEMEYNNVRADTALYNTLLDGLLKVRKLNEACQLFEKMVSEGIRASCYSYNILIDGLFKNGRQAAGFTLFIELKKKGQFVDAITYSIVVQHLCKEGKVEEALELVKEMEERGLMVDLVTITSLLIALHKYGTWDSPEQLTKYVRDSAVLPSVLRWKASMDSLMKGPQDKSKDYTSMFPVVANLSDIMNWINSAPSMNTDAATCDTESKDEWSLTLYLDKLADRSHSFENTSQKLTDFRGLRVEENRIDSFDIDMVNTYMPIFLAKGKLSFACKLFEIFASLGTQPVSYTYNSLLTSFIKKGYLTEAWKILQEMGDKLCPADIATYNLIIQGLGKIGKAELASAVLDQLLKKGGYLDIVMYNTFIHALGKAKRLDEANQLFKQMITSGINPDVVTFNTLIEVHAKAGKVKEAYNFLRKMLAAGCSPNHVTDTILDFLEKEIDRLRYQKASFKRDKEEADGD
ncbi:pentatricopeptide repeat-containing protein At4g01570 [Zingiber officinale]|uniref:pentatricopeptide repeat-containing protein At4g01570 n=1 Tax=Zingiber officinale TaxID=94328 RepID=UPI001C4AAF86|nr:pentatricopeptide repeat-containing protein At4g01570 [Zingiber officinale]XP_042422190.1 pentatricopeptide repeat-containing protein At4g01570 [Zingiber officinale]